MANRRITTRAKVITVTVVTWLLVASVYLVVFLWLPLLAAVVVVEIAVLSWLGLRDRRRAG